MTDAAAQPNPFSVDVSREELVAALRKVRWSHPRALEEARVAIAERLDTTMASCEELARRLGEPRDRVVRNVIAEAPADSLPYWRQVVLARVLMHGEQGLKPLLDALPQSPSEWELVDTLLKGDAEPAQDQYGPFFGTDAVAVSSGVLDAAFRAARPGYPSVSTILRIALGIGSARSTPRPEDLRERLHLLDRAFSVIPPTVRVGIADLVSLPPAWREVLAWRTGLLSRIGGPRLPRAVQRDSMLRVDAARGLQTRGLAALRRRHFLDRALVELANGHSTSIPIDEELLEEALRGGAEPSDPSDQVIRRLERLVRLCPRRLREPLAVLLTPRRARADLLAKMSPQNLATVLSILPAGELPFSETAVAFFTEGRVPGDVGLRSHAAEECLADLARVPRLAVVGGLDAALREKELAPVAAGILGDMTCLAAIAARTGPQGKRVLSALAERLRKEPALASELLLPLLRAVPDWGLRALSPSLPEGLVLEVVRAESVARTVRRSALARACRGKRGESLLDRLLTAATKGKGPVAPLLLEEARRSLPRLARLLAGHRDALARIAIKRLPLRTVLPSALESARFARALGSKYSRSQLIEQIPWIRRRYRAAPHKAAAFELALAIGLSRAGQLCSLARAAAASAGGTRGTFFDGFYRCYKLPKKSGGNRTVSVPSSALMSLQRRLLRFGFGEVPLHPAATGFRPGRSIRDNALPHVGKALVVNVDIASFFPSTRYALVLRACRRLLGGRISPAAARLAADICSFRGALPTGAPTSPVIANIALTPLDKAVGKVCARHGIAYTRYADDLTFSGSSDAKRVLPFVRRLLHQLDYRLDPKKTNLFRKGRRQVVTGLVVNEKPNLPRRLRRKLRAAVDRRVRAGQATWHGKPVTDETLLGLVAHLNLVQPTEARRHRLRLDAVRGTKAAE